MIKDIQELFVTIPTRGRTTFGKQMTLSELLNKSTIKPVLVCPPEDERALLDIYDGVLVCPAKGIGPTRQWLVEYAQKHSVDGNLLMLDDDMYFYQRDEADDADSKLHVLPNLDWPIFEWIRTQLNDGFVHGGLAARQGNNHAPHGSYRDITRVNNFHFFDSRVLMQEGIRFDALPVMEDFFVSLSLITRGYPNRVLKACCWNQRGSGLDGGCSSYRTLELQAEAAHMLHERFPHYVKVVEKEAISGGSVFGGIRTDVIISWLKAWEDEGRTKRPIPRDYVRTRGVWKHDETQRLVTVFEWSPREIIYIDDEGNSWSTTIDDFITNYKEQS